MPPCSLAGVAWLARRARSFRGTSSVVSRDVFDGELGADEGTQAGAAGGLVEARHAVEAVAVGQGEGAMAELGGAVRQVLRVRGALQEGEGAAAAQLDVVRSRVSGRHEERYFRLVFALSQGVRDRPRGVCVIIPPP